MKHPEQGFSFLGLLIVMVTIGFLVIYLTSSTTQQMSQEVAVSLMDRTIGKASEAITRKNIMTLRQGINYYYTQNRVYPVSLDNFGDPPFIPTCLPKIPEAKLGMNVPEEVRSSNRVNYGIEATNKGGWLYDPHSGKVMVNYDGTDREGINYTAY